MYLYNQAREMLQRNTDDFFTITTLAELDLDPDKSMIIKVAMAESGHINDEKIFLRYADLCDWQLDHPAHVSMHVTMTNGIAMQIDLPGNFPCMIYDRSAHKEIPSPPPRKTNTQFAIELGVTKRQASKMRRRGQL
jgi:hypothetical protein